jgi:hypothetical protein
VSLVSRIGECEWVQRRSDFRPRLIQGTLRSIGQTSASRRFGSDLGKPRGGGTDLPRGQKSKAFSRAIACLLHKFNFEALEALMLAAGVPTYTDADRNIAKEFARSLG